jgi:hypothetical protein
MLAAAAADAVIAAAVEVLQVIAAVVDREVVADREVAAAITAADSEAAAVDIAADTRVEITSRDPAGCLFSP